MQISDYRFHLENEIDIAIEIVIAIEKVIFANKLDYQ